MLLNNFVTAKSTEHVKKFNLPSVLTKNRRPRHPVSVFVPVFCVSLEHSMQITESGYNQHH